MSKINKKIDDVKAALEIKEINNWYFTILFALTTIVFFWGHLSGTVYFWEDFLEYVYPIQTYAAVATKNGSIPFWNPYVFNGMPFLADIQVGFFYPFNRVLSLFVSSDGYLSVWGIQFIIIFHFFIAQTAFFFLMRYKKVSQLGSAISAIGYSFSMMMVCHVFHPMIVYHLAWLPLVFMLLLKALNFHDYRYGLGAGLVLGISMLSGHPQTTLYEAVFLGVYFLWYLIENYKSIKNKFISTAIAGFLTFIVALGVFQIQFLTSNELAELSLRADISVEKSSLGSLEIKQITNFVNPHQFGKMSGNQNEQSTFSLIRSDGTEANYFYYWETAFYFGIVILLFGLIGLLHTFKSSLTKFLAIMMMIGFLYSLGSNFFLHSLIDYLPYFGQFRIPSRMMMFVIFGMTILAGFGFDSLIKAPFAVIRNNILISTTIVLALILVSIFSGSHYEKAIDTALVGLLFLAISAAVSIVLGLKKIGYYVAGIILILVLFIDLYNASGDFNDSSENPENAYRIDPNMLSSFMPNLPENIFRVNTRSYQPPFIAVKRNQGMVNRFMSSEGYNPLVLQRINPKLPTPDEIHDLLNVKYILRINPQTNQPYFEENFDRKPNAWLVNKAYIFTPESVGDRMYHGKYDLTREVLLEENIELKLNSEDSIRSKVVCREYKENYIRYEILNPDADVILVMSEIWYPAWKVFVDGLPAKLHRANYSLRAVEVPKGASKIELRFASQSFALGQWITIVTLIISIPLLFIGTNWRIKK